VKTLRNLAALALLLFCTRGAVPSATYWVLLDEAVARSTLPPAVSAEVIAQRPLFDTDRPVDPAAVRAIERTGAEVLYVSRMLRAVAVRADARTLRRIAQLDGVANIERTRRAVVAGSAPQTPLFVNAEARPGAVAAAQDSARYGHTYPSLRELGLPLLHALGFTGTNIRIGILDTGFYLSHQSLRGLRVAAQRDFVDGDNNVAPEPDDHPDQARHGTHVWSLLGGFDPGDFIGGAYGATFYLAKVDAEPLQTNADEVRWVAGVEWLDSLGVRLINSSIGFQDFSDRARIPYGDLDGNTTRTTRLADEVARRGILMVVAMGDRGPENGTLWAPADADSIISVGSVDSLTATGIAVPTNVSSRGPTADGRTKPELAARGGNVVGASLRNAEEYEGGLFGSSYATPLITAGAALFMEAWPNFSIMAVREALMLAGSNERPNNSTGKGVPNVAGAVMFPSGIVLTNASLINTDLAGNLTTIVPTFRWQVPEVHPRMTPITYRIDVATDSLFTDIVYSDTTIEAFAHTARQPMRPLPRAYWRVVAMSPTGVRRVSPPRPAFRVPSWVRLLTLAEPTVEFINELQPELSWAPLAAPAPIGPFTYDVQILSATNQIVQQVRNLNTSSTRVPEPLTPNQNYRWRVIARTTTGVADTVESPSQFVVESTEAPPATLLYPPFPNPFPHFTAGSEMRVWFDLARESRVELAVYDIRMRLVRTLIPATGCSAITLPPGVYGRSGQSFDVPTAPNGQPCASVTWDGTDSRGEPAPRGVYVVTLRADGIVSAHRILYLPND
jgi:hypothetical protein